MTETLDTRTSAAVETARGLDVLVIGCGLAGIRAAVAAAEAGCGRLRVGIATAGHPFSGSTFFAGTWGLGLVGPTTEDAADIDSLVQAILQVGQGMADPVLARTLVAGVPAAVADLEARGVELRHPDPLRADEKDYIPCFDTRHRSWHGLGRASFRRVMQGELERLGVALLPHPELLDLIEADGRVTGAQFATQDGTTRRLVVPARSVVLATGGYGGLFSRALTAPDVRGAAQAVALRHGGRLVNLEFMQIMPGMVAPVRGVVFNEKMFRYARVPSPIDSSDDTALNALMRERAEHGPFTASRPDRLVDLAVARAGDKGLPLAFDLPHPLPEFMQTYCDWFAHAFGKSACEGVCIAPYAHAANGGILIDARARCVGAPSGLFACGEVTGGMHGADRIGGLASANALVFGQIAGTSAAVHALGATTTHPTDTHEAEKNALLGFVNDDELLRIRTLLTRHCMLSREEAGLTQALAQLQAMRPTNECLMARSVVAAMLDRRESRGGHFRLDHPALDPAQAAPRTIDLVRVNASPA